MPAVERGLAKAGRDRASIRGVRSAVRRHRHDRRGDRGREAGGAAADRVLRLDARVPRRARAARLGRSADRAQPALEAGRVGARWASSSTTTMLNTFAVVGRARRRRPELKRRYGGVVDRCSFYAPYRTDPERWAARHRGPAVGVAQRSSCSGRRTAGSTRRTRRDPVAGRSGRVRAITSSVPCGMRSAICRRERRAIDRSTPRRTPPARRRRSSPRSRARAVVRRHRVHARLDLGPALQLEHAVAAVAQPVLDVRAQRLRGHDVERRLRRVRGVRLVGRRHSLRRLRARGAREKSSCGRERFGRREHDRLVGPDPRERSRALLLAEDQRGAALRVAARDERRIAGDAEVIGDREHVVGEAVPRVVASRARRCRRGRGSRTTTRAGRAATSRRRPAPRPGRGTRSGARAARAGPSPPQSCTDELRPAVDGVRMGSGR